MFLCDLILLGFLSGWIFGLSARLGPASLQCHRIGHDVLWSGRSLPRRQAVMENCVALPNRQQSCHFAGNSTLVESAFLHRLGQRLLSQKTCSNLKNSLILYRTTQKFKFIFHAISFVRGVFLRARRFSLGTSFLTAELKFRVEHVF